MSTVLLPPSMQTIESLGKRELDIRKVTTGHINSDVLLTCSRQSQSCWESYSKVIDICQTSVT